MTDNNRVRLITKSGEEEAFKAIVRYCFNDMGGWSEYIFPLMFGDRAWGCFSGDALESALITRSYESRIFSSWQKMSGISFVQSLPEYRNKDNVTLLMKRALVEDRDSGAVFSTLYPFKFRYYERFGYGYVGGPVSFSFQPEDLDPPKDTAGELVAFTGAAEQLEDIANVSEAWVSGFGMGTRPRRLPDDAAREEIARSNDRIVLYYRDGEARGFVRMQKVIVSQFVSQLNVKKAAWTEPEAFYAILGLLKKHRDQIREVIWQLPCSVKLGLAMKEPRVQSTELSDYMARPLDIKRVIELKVKQRKAERIARFSVEDPDLPENTATYEIEGDESRKLGYTGENPIPLPVFSSLVFGGYSLADAKLAGRLPPDFPEDLADFFVRDPDIFISERF